MSKANISVLRDLCKRYLKNQDAPFVIHTDDRGYTTITFTLANDTYSMPKTFHIFGVEFKRSEDGIYRQVSRVTYRKGQHHSLCIMQTFMILSLDVWGNKNDGYEINAAYHTYRHIQLPKEPTDKDVVQALVNAGELSRGSFAALKHGTLTLKGELSGIGSILTVEHKGKPILQIELTNVNDF